MAPLYDDVRAYCSHVKTVFLKGARLLSSNPRLFIHSSFIHSFIRIKVGVMWSNLGVRQTNRARQFCTRGFLAICVAGTLKSKLLQ